MPYGRLASEPRSDGSLIHHQSGWQDEWSEIIATKLINRKYSFEDDSYIKIRHTPLSAQVQRTNVYL